MVRMPQRQAPSADEGVMKVRRTSSSPAAKDTSDDPRLGADRMEVTYPAVA